jgi:membrane associated rhomboid family serine protease
MVLPLGDSEPTRIVPWATYTLIALNLVIYLAQLRLGDEFTAAFAATPYEISHDEDIDQPFQLRVPVGEDPLGRVTMVERVVPQGPVPFPVWLTLFTSMFLHGSPLHLAGNMLFLWIFGDNVEEVLGSIRYVIVYLCCGLAASLAQILPNPDSYVPTLGASGAIAGIMGAYLVWFPHNLVRVLVFRVIIAVPAWVVIGLWIAFQIWRGIGSLGHLGQVGGVAYLAHVGGAVVGIAVAFLFQDRALALGQPSWSSEQVG